jgi:hypothetical protein
MVYLDILLLLVPLQSVAFWGFIWAFKDPLNIQMQVSWYQTLATQCIVLPVKFDAGLPISVLRNKQLFDKKDVKSWLLLWSLRHDFVIALSSIANEETPFLDFFFWSTIPHWVLRRSLQFLDTFAWIISIPLLLFIYEQLQQRHLTTPPYYNYTTTGVTRICLRSLYNNWKSLPTTA